MPRASPPLTALPLCTLLLCVAAHLACAVSRRPPPSHVPAASPVLDVAALGRMERARVTPRAFEPALAASHDVAVRSRAMLALARLEHIDAVPLLFAGSRDDSPTVRAHAAFGLGQLDEALSLEKALHQEIRKGVERRLVVWLSGESDREVRQAILRALGRISLSDGLDALVQATTQDDVGADALYAIGVSGVRRGPLLQTEPRLHTSIERALASPDPSTLRAGAYAAFRQRVPLDASVYVAAGTWLDVEARVHLARAWQESKVPFREVTSLLHDPEWRVRVEVLRGALLHARRGDLPSLDVLAAAGTQAARALTAGTSAEAHVVGELCDVLGDPSFPAAPEALVGVVESTLSSLQVETGAAAVARCRCAVAHDALLNKFELVDTCEEIAGLSRRQLRVDALQRMRLSTPERIRGLATLAGDDDVTVRLAVARAPRDDVHAVVHP
ncbi:MAG: HEAT repeat domain-containing protein, partial [Myxococcota bacterium]